MLKQEQSRKKVFQKRDKSILGVSVVPSGEGRTHHYTRRSIGQLQTRPAPGNWSSCHQPSAGSWPLIPLPRVPSLLAPCPCPFPQILPGFQYRPQRLPHPGPQGSPRPTSSVHAQHPASTERGSGGSEGDVTGASADTQAWARELHRPLTPDLPG